MKLLFSMIEISGNSINALIIKENIYSKIISLFNDHSNCTIVLIAVKKFITWTFTSKN